MIRSILPEDERAMRHPGGRDPVNLAEKLETVAERHEETDDFFLGPSPAAMCTCC
jgi:hypothetical protein